MIKNRHLAGAGVMLLGCVAAYNAIPNSIRPTPAKSPFHKSTQTVTVDIGAPSVQFIDPSNHSIKVACGVPTAWSWAMGPPSEVHVLFRYGGHIINDVTKPCPKST